MVAVTRLNKSLFYINALLIETIEETPDTLITLTTGKKLLVLEKATDVIASVQSYLHSIGVYTATLKSDQKEDSST